MQMRNLIQFQIESNFAHFFFSFNSIKIDENATLCESFEYLNFMQMRNLIQFALNEISLHFFFEFY